MNKRVRNLKRGIIVSCQKKGNDELFSPEIAAFMARSATLSGAVGLRVDGADCIRAVKSVSPLPIIGILKRRVEGVDVRITPTFEDAREVAEAGADIIALDGTQRPRPGNLTLAELIQKIHRELRLSVMADVSTCEEGVRAAQAGADFIATTLSGYTPYTIQRPRPDIKLVRELKRSVDVPVIAEGNLHTPGQAVKALLAGAYAVVVGSAITSPGENTLRFVKAVKPLTQENSKFAIVVDIGGTKTAIALMAYDGSISQLQLYPTPTQKPNQLIEFLREAIRDILNQYEDSAITGIGISTGGIVDPHSGTILHATPLLPGWMGTPVVDILQREFQLPVRVDNDGNMGAIGEYLYGAAKGSDPLVFIAIGTGIGGGAIIDGQLLKGKQGGALNLGHIQVEKDGIPCNCGGRGCLEAYSSGRAIEQAYIDKKGDLSTDSNLMEITAQAIFQRCANGESMARKVIDRALSYLARGISILIELFDPEAIVLGGGVSESLGEYLDELRTKVSCAHRLFSSENITLSTLGQKANLIGAGASLLFSV
ncbi:putative N-acetylmannosamine-6-phosphate 2-epimerase [Candidatus Sumerlaeota bacterium]|nr:putative N-acetylmannosamine-6-phosphate 2-epimerase [Candidatus Sumerlaeota bacterium]